MLILVLKRQQVTCCVGASGISRRKGRGGGRGAEELVRVFPTPLRLPTNTLKFPGQDITA